jgi:hypothetical protein
VLDIEVGPNAEGGGHGLPNPLHIVGMDHLLPLLVGQRSIRRKAEIGLEGHGSADQAGAQVAVPRAELSHIERRP